jgi:hypothetical protein
MTTRVIARAALAACAALVLLGPSAVMGDEQSNDAKIERLEEQLAILAEEIDKLRKEEAVPEKKPLVSEWGLGPAASKVYTKERGVSIGGYGEIAFKGFLNDSAPDGENNVFDAVRAVLYVGYKFNDNWVVNGEFEFEHAGTGGGGSVSVEFLTLDFLWKEPLNLRGGLVLIPMGFINEMHEPTTFYSVQRPETERRIIPSTWRENGVGIFGKWGDRVTYRVYAVNGMDGSGFDATGLRGGRQKGSKALANDWAGVGRIDFDVWRGIEFGGSVYAGNSGQGQEWQDTGTEVPDLFTTIWEIHAQWKAYGASIRALWSEAYVTDTGEFNALTQSTGDPANLAETLRGGYVEAGYDIMPLLMPETRMSLSPFFRYEYLDTQAEMADGWNPIRSLRRDIVTAGLNYKPISQVVVKLDYQHTKPREQDSIDVIQFGLGYVF